jgi:hypothetical protein
MSTDWKTVAELWREYARAPLDIERAKECFAIHEAAEAGEIPDAALAWDRAQRAMVESLTAQLDRYRDKLSDACAELERYRQHFHNCGECSDCYELEYADKPQPPDDDWDGSDCEVCGFGVSYGSRHHQCGSAVQGLEARCDSYRQALERLDSAVWDWLTFLEDKGGHYYDGIPGDLMEAAGESRRALEGDE